MPFNAKSSELHLKESIKHFTIITGDTTYTMNLKDRVVILNTAAAVAGTLTLPPVAECGGMYFVIKDDGNYGANVTIQDQNDSINWSDLTNNAADEAGVFLSDSSEWHALKSDF